ncbi:MAG: phospho-N-acetylmuramoyl-pentapeptide-transferase [Planctomycetes bacterium]|nr:phospho-N-acetylmuramoyl-pentapeptide-transferase [Planctomycetota bacterium]
MAVAEITLLVSGDAMLHVVQRTAFAGALACAIGLLCGPIIVRVLKRLRTQETVEKSDSPTLADLSKGKRDTPTMGGVLFLPAVGGALACFGNLENPQVLHALLGAIGFCLIGAIDDVLKLTRRGRTDGKKSGISGRGKMALQVGVSAALAFALVSTMNQSSSDPEVRRQLFSITVPFTTMSIDLSFASGWPYAIFCTLIMVGTSNAVNLTDGLDGLAPGCIVLASAAFAIIAYAVGRSDAASHLHIPHVDGAEEMAVVAAALAGAGVAFLWFNAHPAQVFLGDTGSLALGGLLGYIACATKQELVLPIVGGVFVAEALSVILQVASFKSRGKRIFRCAPLHHHFQFGGMHEVKIVTRFWIVAGLCALAGLATLTVR